jgi:ribonucleoside-diphosphate reductase alpha chain
MSALARDAAITLSIALQHGVTADSIRNAITRESNGIAAGLVGAVLDHLEGGANG